MLSEPGANPEQDQGILEDHEGCPSKKEIRILIIGLDGAGKTAILYKLKLDEENVKTIPTIGYNDEKVQYKNIDFRFWDIGGLDTVRALWKHCYQQITHVPIEGIIFVVDSTDRDRITEAKDELWFMLAKDELKEIILLIFANKQDLPNAMSSAEITDKLGLQSLENHKWHIQTTCGISGDGLYDGLEWLFNQT